MLSTVRRLLSDIAMRLARWRWHLSRRVSRMPWINLLGMLLGCVSSMLVGGGLVWWRAAPAPNEHAGPASPDERPEYWQHELTLEGRIFDEEGEPFPGAQVCTQQACAQTGPDGRYRLERLSPVADDLFVHAKGHETASERVELVPGDDNRVNLSLRRGGEGFSVFVRDLDGHPIVGARVANSRITDHHRVVDDDWGQATDIHGRTERWSSEDSLFHLSIEASGYASRECFLLGVWPGSVELTLFPESRILGRVLDTKTGLPVVGTEVFARSSRLGPRMSAHTDARGDFDLRGLEPGLYSLRAEGVGVLGRVLGKVHVGLGEAVSGVVIEAHEGVSVSGELELAGSERRCPRGSVSLHLVGEHWSSRRSARVRGGAFLFDTVLPGTYEVELECSGQESDKGAPDLVVDGSNIDGLRWRYHAGRGHWSGPLWPSRDPSEPKPEELPEGEAVFWGRVVDEGGVAVSEVALQLSRREPNFSAWTHADEGGHFMFTKLPSTRLVLSANTLEGPRFMDDLKVLSIDEFDVVDSQFVSGVEVVVESRRHIIRGHVTDERGQPVSGALVFAEERALVSSYEWAIYNFWRDPKHRGVLTDAHGQFTLMDRYPREHVVHAYRLGGERAYAESVMPGEPLSLKVSPMASIAGAAVGECVLELCSFHIGVWDEAGERVRQEFVANGRGQWRIDGLFPGDYTVGADEEGAARVAVSLASGQHLDGITLPHLSRERQLEVLASRLLSDAWNFMRRALRFY